MSSFDDTRYLLSNLRGSTFEEFHMDRVVLVLMVHALQECKLERIVLLKILCLKPICHNMVLHYFLQFEFLSE